MTWANPTAIGNAHSGNVASPSLVKTLTGNVAAGNSVFVLIWGTGLLGMAFTITDTQGNSYHVDLSGLGIAGVASMVIAAAHNCVALASGSDAITVSLSGSGSNQDWGFDACTAAPGAGCIAALDVNRAGTPGSATTPTSGATGTVSGGSELVFSVASFYAGVTPPSLSGANSYTLLTSDSFTGASLSWAGGIAYQNLAAATGTQTGNGITSSQIPNTNGSLAGCVVYKTTATAPNITVQPVNRSVTTPATASFTATATSGGGGTFTWQWQRSTDAGATWANIGGATGSGGTASYTTPATMIGDSGTQFRVVYTNATGSTTSAAAVLAVAVALTSLQLTLAASGQGLCSAQVIVTGDSAGAADYVRPTIKVEVDWTNTGVWVDESSNYLSVDIQRGRQQATDVFGPGSATVIMKNTTGKYGPYNTFSPLYPNVVSGRPMRVTASFQGVSYRRFQGTISEVQEAAVPGYASVTLACIDAFEQFRLSTVAAALQTSARTDQVIAAILTAAGWAGGTTLATGRTLSSYAQTTTNMLQALQHAAQQDVRGVVFMGKDGTVTFQNATYRSTQPVWHVFTSVEQETLDVRQSDLINTVRTTYQTYVWPKSGTAVSSVYSGQQGLALPAQSPTVITDSFSTPAAQNVVTPVAGTDYTANDKSDGSGLDVSNNVWARQFTTTGTQFTATIYNGLPYTVYLQTFQIRGNGLNTNQAAPFLMTPVAAQQAGLVSGPTTPLGLSGWVQAVATSPVNLALANQQYAQSFDYATDPTLVSDWTQRAAAALRNPHPRPVVRLSGKTAALTHALLGLDLSSRIVLSDLVSPHIVGNAGQFFVEAIHETYQPAAAPMFSLTLFDQEQGAL